MRASPFAPLLCLPLACAQVLELGAFGAGGPASGGHGGSAGTPVVGGSGGEGGDGGVQSGGYGGAPQGGGGMGGVGCADDYVSLVKGKQLAAYIRFEEQEGETVQAEDGAEGDVASAVELAVAGLPPCVGESAASFPGLGGSNVDFGPVLGFEGQSSFSLEAWFVTEALNGRVIGKLSGAPANGYVLTFWNSSFFFRRYRDGNANSIEAPSSVVGTNAVHHVVATYDGSLSWMCLYVDGAEVLCKSSSLAIVGTSGNFLVGTSAFKGVIDEVAVYSTALSLADVQAHYAAGWGNPFP